MWLYLIIASKLKQYVITKVSKTIWDISTEKNVQQISVEACLMLGTDGLFSITKSKMSFRVLFSCGLSARTLLILYCYFEQ